MESRSYAGQLIVKPYGETESLFLSSLDEPLAEELEWMNGRQVTVRYWITDYKCTRDQAVDSFLKRCAGVAETEYNARYSDITGYLWTDENIRIGGHDLLDELSTEVGKWLILEIDAAEGSPSE